MNLIPASYAESRERFRSRLEQVRARWPGAALTSHPLPYEGGLTIDVILAPALASRQRLFVLTTAEHGIEGYLGSALQEHFIQEYLPRLDPATTGLLLVHAINPWGMQNWKRNNPNNVDLNRSFFDGDFAGLATVNPDYPTLAPFLSPQRPLGSLALEQTAFAARTVYTLARYGAGRIREAALMGQYIQPTGIYFGGRELQPETRILMALYRAAFDGYANIIHLDLHTGYGPRTRMTLVNSPHEPLNAAQTTARYGTPLVAAANPQEFYSMNGDMLDWEYQLVKREFPAARIFAAACEFGTFGEGILAGARSLRVTVFKNQLNLFGAPPATRAWVDAEYRELYLPSAPDWFAKALSDARQTFEGVLKAEGF